MTSATGRWDSERDTDILFTQHSIDEIREIERKTREDVENKKEELRQMVGERYRDLISAADSIVDIAHISKEVCQLVKQLQDNCSDLRQVYQLKGFAGSHVPLEGSQLKAFLLSAQIRVLVDLPSKIWSCLESKSCLKAAQYHLLAQYIAGRLQLEEPDSAVLTALPVLSNHWASLSNIQGSIIQVCRDALTDGSLGEKGLTDNLCAILLLEGGSIRQVFNEFLIARKSAIQDILHSATVASTRVHMVHLATCIRASLHLIASIFSQQDGEHSLLFQTLDRIIQSQSQGEPLLSEFTARSYFKHLPSDIKKFGPNLRITPAEIPQETLHSLCNEWINNITDDEHRSVAQLLQHVPTVKALSSIRLSVFDVLKEPLKEGSVPQDEWENTCQLALGHKISIWTQFIEPALYQRAEEIVGGNIENISSHATAAITEIAEDGGLLSRFDCNIISYMWSPEASSSYHGESKTMTPAIMRFCIDLNEKLHTILEDIQHLLLEKDHTKLASHISKKRMESQYKFPFDAHAKDNDLRRRVASLMEGFINHMVAKVDVCLTNLRRKLDSLDQSNDEGSCLINRILVLGRLCNDMIKHTPSLHTLLLGIPMENRSLHRLQSSVVKNRDINLKEDPLPYINKSLWDRFLEVHRIWIGWTKTIVINHLIQCLKGTSDSGYLYSSSVWECVCIKEETEDGNLMESNIQVPSQVSSFIAWLMYTLCREIGRIGGHWVPRLMVEKLSYEVLQGTLQVYSELLDGLRDGDNLMQNCAVQMWFDIKYLSSVLVVQKNEVEHLKDGIQALQRRIESFIDPFDMSVFYPYLLYYLELYKQKTQILYGALTSLTMSSGLAASRGGKPSGLPQDKHQILPLGTTVGRFTLLPIGGGGSGKKKHDLANNTGDVFLPEKVALNQTVKLYQNMNI